MYNVEVLGVHSPLLPVDVLVLGLYFSFVLSERQRKRECVYDVVVCVCRHTFLAPLWRSEDNLVSSSFEAGYPVRSCRCEASSPTSL